MDPEDPLYGLDKRLKNMELDDESRRILVEKLKEASEKMKLTLDDRQSNLDQKMQSAGGKKK